MPSLSLLVLHVRGVPVVCFAWLDRGNHGFARARVRWQNCYRADVDGWCRVQMLRVKTMFSQPVTGPILLGLARTYAAAINNDVVPSIGDAWEEVSRAECQVLVSLSWSLVTLSWLLATLSWSLATLSWSLIAVTGVHGSHLLRSWGCCAAAVIGPGVSNAESECMTHDGDSSGLNQPTEG